MNIKRSYFKLLMASAGVGLLLANCTVKETDECSKGDKDSGCDCPGNAKGYQVCDGDGVYGECICPDSNTAGTGNTAGTNSSTAGTNGNEGGTPSAGTGGTTAAAGSDAGGVAAVNGGAGGEGGDLGFVVEDPNDCEACLSALCRPEYDACLADTRCFSETGNGTGQYERIITCVDGERLNGPVKRDVVRGCGVTIGLSPNPDLASDWAPQNMAPATTNLLNCLATSANETPNADWANSDDNFPIVNDDVVPTPWPADSCAKLSCTAKFE